MCKIALHSNLWRVFFLQKKELGLYRNSHRDFYGKPQGFNLTS